MMKKSNSIMAWGLGVIVAAWLGSALAVDPVPDWMTLVFPSMVPKAGHPNQIPADLQTGLIRHAYETRFENYWKEVSYFDYNRSTGQKIRGAYTDTKTYGYIEMPWPLAPRESQGEFRRGTGLGDIFRPERHEGAQPDGATDPASGEAGTPRRRHSQTAFSSPNYAFHYDGADFDEVWTPGESFQDTTGDGQWTPPLPAEDFYDLNSDGTWNVAGGEQFADFNGDGTYSPQAQVWMYQGDAGTNTQVALNEFIQASDGVHELVFDPNMGNPYVPGDPRLPVEALVTLDVDGNMESVVIPQNTKFDYTTTADGVPQFVLVADVTEAYPGGSQAYVNTNPAGEDRGYYFYEDVRQSAGPYVDGDGNPIAGVELRAIRARVYAAAELYGAYKSSTVDVNIFGDLRGPVGQARRVIDPEDGRPTEASPGDLFEDFISFYDAEQGGHVYVQPPPVGHPDDHLRANIDPLRGNALPNGSVNVRGRPFSITWNEYKAYIEWNYPGDADALIARAFNGRYDGPDEWQVRIPGASGKWRIDYDDPFTAARTFPPIPATVNAGTGGLNWPSSNPGGGWDPRSGFATWEDWYEQVLGDGNAGWAPAWNTVIPTIERYTANSGPNEDDWYPATSWGYQSPAEYCDLPSSIYHLRGNYAAGATLVWQDLSEIPGTGDPFTDFSPANALFMPGGDRRLGEVTSPWNDDIWGHDIESVANWYGPGDRWIPSAGPYAFNTIGGHGYDGANLATMELMTHRRSGVPGVDQHPRYFRDTNLDGYVDGGYELEGDANYSTDQTGVGGFGQYGEFTWYRYMEDVIALWDQSEDFRALYNRVNTATPSAQRLYAYPIYPVSPGNEGWAALSGPAGQVLDFISRDTGNPMHLTFQVRPMNAGGEAPGMGPDGPDPDWDPNQNPAVQDFGMALLAHEQGHDLMGWPDLYDYDTWSGGNPIFNNPIGSYDLMAAGAMVHGLPVLKEWALIGAGWIQPQDLTALVPVGGGPVVLEIYPVEYYRNQYYRIQNPNPAYPNEFFDLWFTDNDTEYPVVGGRGVYISHVDLGGNPHALPIQQKVNNRFTYEMVQADGLTELQDNINSGDEGDPFPGTRNMRTWSAHTLPAARWWDQADTGFRILDIELPPEGSREPARILVDRYDTSQATDFPLSGTADTDGDGIPDAWEFYFFGNLSTAGPNTDFSGNGLTDRYEFLAGTNPLLRDTSGDGISDADTDTDGDGLTNIEEQMLGTHPRLPDTTDNGFLDGSPEARIDPLNSLSPMIDRVLRLINTNPLQPSYVQMPEQDRFALPSFTLQSWVMPEVYPGTEARLIVRRVAVGAENYALVLLSDGRIQLRFQPRAAGMPVVTFTSPIAHALPLDAWSHVAASFNEATGRMALFVNGVEISSQTTSSRPVLAGSGPVQTRVGEGFTGWMDEVALFSRALNATEIQSTLEGVAGSTLDASADLISYYRFDDGTSAVGPDANGLWLGTSGWSPGTAMNPIWIWGQVEEFAPGFEEDWWNDWRNAGTLRWHAYMVELGPDGPVEHSKKDSNNDGIPDWWYIRHGLDPRGDSVANDNWDGTGVSNYWQFRLNADPYNPYSLDPTGALNDAEFDSDGDGLSNIDEITIWGTDPTNPDTADNGFWDGDPSDPDPARSLSPFRDLVLHLDGAANSYVLTPRQGRFDLDQFTLMAWVNPSRHGGTLIERQSQTAIRNYQLRMRANGTVELRFTRSDRSGEEWVLTPNPLPIEQWTHVAATFDRAAGRMRIYFDGVQVAARTTVYRPGNFGFGVVETRIGAGMQGFMDEVAFFDRPLSVDEVRLMMHGIQGRNSENLVSYYSFDDGTSAQRDPADPLGRHYGTSGNPGWWWGQVEEFAPGYDRDWLNEWRNAGTLMGGVEMVPADDAPVRMSLRDANNDGIPDWWYILFGFDPRGPSVAYQDSSGDGLWNLTKYRLFLLDNRYDPRNRDSFGDGIPDGERDADGDGLTNLYEQNVSGTRPDMADTDDDGLTDWEEVTGKRLLRSWWHAYRRWQDGRASRPPDVNDHIDTAAGTITPTDPLASTSPYRQGSLRVSGAGHVEVPDQARHNLRSWSVQAWARPNSVNMAGGSILRRTVHNPYRGGFGINYEAGLEPDGEGGLRLYARYAGVRSDGSLSEVRIDSTQPAEQVTPGAENQVMRSQWTHVAATYDAERRTLAIYINGERISRRVDANEPVGLGFDEEVAYPGELRIGDGFVGNIDDVLILGGASTAESIQATARGEGRFSAALLGYRNPVWTGSPIGPGALSPGVASGLDHRRREIMVRFTDDVTPSAVRGSGGLAAQLGLSERRLFEIVPVYVMRIVDGSSMRDKLTELQRHRKVQYAEPNYTVEALSAVPNDALYRHQWALKNTGQSGGTPGADIDAEGAWAVGARGTKRVRIAIIDSGIDYTHPDLWPNMWHGIGRNFYEDEETPLVDDPMDDDGHGTHVAGTIGAVGNNGIGIVGVNWTAEMMAVRLLGDEGGTTAGAIASIEYAWKNGARLSNNSWGGMMYSQAMFDTIVQAGRYGHLFVAAAGNDGLDVDRFPFSPAMFNLPNMITVAASDRNDNPADFSNYGASAVHLAAPGVDILSTLPGGRYGEYSGTSMAAPHVTGVAALIWSQNPHLSAAAVKNLILGSVDVLPQWDGLVATGGRLNAARALGGRGALVGFFAFNDWGETVEDFSYAQDWENDWAHAGILRGDARFDNSRFRADDFDSNDDGIPDWWYVQYGLDPTGPSVAHEDWDEDGLINLYEYLAGTDPRNSDTAGDGASDYDSLSEPGGLTWGEIYDDGDGLPYQWELQFPGQLDPDTFDAFDDSDGDGWDNLSEYFAGTDPTDPNSVPRPTVHVQVDYAGDALHQVRWVAWDNPALAGRPIASGLVNPGVGSGVLDVGAGALMQGANYLQFFGLPGADEELWNTWEAARWSGRVPWQPGRPAGVPDQFPLNVSWGEVHGVRVGLADAVTGYPRLSWAAVEGSTEYRVSIRRRTTEGMPVIFEQRVRGRTFLHETDFRQDPRHLFGLEADSDDPIYEWYVDGVSQGTFRMTSDWSDPLDAPAGVSPSGTLRLADTPFVWTMDEAATAFELEIRANSATGRVAYASGLLPVPVPDPYGMYAFRISAREMPLEQGTTYFWRVRMQNPRRASVWSDFHRYTVDLRPSAAGPFGIRGQLWYMGRARVTDIVIQAFRSSGFGGEPVAQTRVMAAGQWQVNGLSRGTYYLRAFMDINGNGEYDFFEPYGILRDPHPYAVDFSPKGVTVGGAAASSGHLLIVRDVDTDNDGYSDAWEWQNFGRLDAVGAGDSFDYALHSTERGVAFGSRDTPVLVRLLADPAAGGTVSGAGSYTYGESITVRARANAGYGFRAWTEGGRLVSSDRDYTFFGLEDRLLVARFVRLSDVHPFSVYHPASGTWSLLNPVSGAPMVAQWGWSEAIPVPGDYDGDGVEDVAVYHPASGTWLIHESSTGQQRVVSWGWSGAIAVPADYDGDGVTDIAVYHPATGAWHIWQSASQTPLSVTWGWHDAIPVPGDYDGDGRADIAVYHPGSGNWHIWQSASQTPRSATWGWSEAVPVPGDYDGDGVTDIAVYHPATGAWHIWQSASQTPRSAVWGWAEAIPIPGDYDGDGIDDIAVYHQASGAWYVWESGLQSGRVQIWGWSDAMPTSVQFWINRSFGLE